MQREIRSPSKKKDAGRYKCKRQRYGDIHEQFNVNGVHFLTFNQLRPPRARIRCPDY